MVRRVSQDDVDEGTGAGTEPVGRANTSPRSRGDAICQRYRTGALQPELRHKGIHAAQVELAFWHIPCLVKSGQCDRIAAGDSKQPVSKDAFVIDQVADALLDRPLTFGIAKHRSRFAQACGKAIELLELGVEMDPNTSIWKRRKELAVERSRFIGRNLW